MARRLKDLLGGKSVKSTKAKVLSERAVVDDETASAREERRIIGATSVEARVWTRGDI